MGLVIDLILAAVAIFIIVRYTVKGFIRSLFGMLKLAISAVATFIVMPLVFHPEDLKTKIIAYLIVFIVIYVILTIVIRILDKVFSLPILNIVNKLLGFALGVISAYIVVRLLAAGMTLVLTVAGEKLFGETLEQVTESTYIFRFINSFGIFPLLGK